MDESSIIFLNSKSFLVLVDIIGGDKT